MNKVGRFSAFAVEIQPTRLCNGIYGAGRKHFIAALNAVCDQNSWPGDESSSQL